MFNSKQKNITYVIFLSHTVFFFLLLCFFLFFLLLCFFFFFFWVLLVCVCGVVGVVGVSVVSVVVVSATTERSRNDELCKSPRWPTTVRHRRLQKLREDRALNVQTDGVRKMASIPPKNPPTATATATAIQPLVARARGIDLKMRVRLHVDNCKKFFPKPPKTVA